MKDNIHVRIMAIFDRGTIRYIPLTFVTETLPGGAGLTVIELRIIRGIIWVCDTQFNIIHYTMISGIKRRIPYMNIT